MDLDQLYDLLEEESKSEMWPSYEQLQSSGTRYEHDSILGEGALKRVYRTYDSKARRWVAYAELKQEFLQGMHEESFIQEAWLTSMLDHPNIIKVHDVGISAEGVPFFTMDLRRNHTMSDLPSESVPFSELLGGYLKVLDAMEYAHNTHVLHLDLKPENIQCDHFGQVLVCDWGLAKYTRIEHEDGEADPMLLHLDPRQTLHGSIKGTPGFMAPEQARPKGEDGAQKDARTDIFALGALLYYLLTGQRPYEGDTQEILLATQEGRIRPPSRPLNAQQRSLLAISLKAMRTAPAERYQSVSALRADLLRFQDGYVPLAEQASFVKRGRLFLLRHQTSVIAVLAAAVLLVIFLSAYQSYQQSLELEALRAQHYQQEARALTEERDRIQNNLEESSDIMAEAASQIGITGYSVTNNLFWQDHIRRHYGKNNRHLVGSINQSRRILNSTIALQPIDQRSSDFKHWVYTNFYALNFQAILQEENTSSDKQAVAIYDYAQKYPSFGWWAHDGPSIQELEVFFAEAAGDRRIVAKKLEVAFRFNWSVRPEADRHQFTRIVLSVLHKNNQDDPTFQAQYDPATSHIIISSEASNPVYHSLISESYASLLAYLPVHSIEIRTPNAPFDIQHVDQSECKILDLTEVKQVIHGAPFEAPMLQVLYLNADSYAQLEELRQPLPLKAKAFTFQVKMAPR